MLNGWRLPDDPASGLRLKSPDYIAANFPLSRVPEIPEIQLHAAGPASGMHRLRREAGLHAAPYWAFRWAGGLALSRYILDNPAVARGRRTLDLGAGGGIVAIAAAMAGASSSRAVDVDPAAIVATRLNAAANGVRVEAIVGDLLDDPPPDVDLILVGDLFYAEDLARRVVAFLDGCALAGREVLVGDPGRAFLPARRLASIATYEVIDMGMSKAKPASLARVYRYAPVAARAANVV